ncbi:hypothetical protein LSH36_56g03048 [Paralvinella palmiformis]|uniref:Uncharacterized protein n=1 Tax=Paralvinella palmiformis TaxID=53620 RepID=A0AAD9NDX2_9ANNE|nr:hypothetical protein LSH36_56g03048 [Paralvinella palmiformis]
MLCPHNLSAFLQHMPNKVVRLGMTKENVATLMSVLAVSVICCRIIVSIMANLKWINRMAMYGCGIVVGGISKLPKAMAILNLVVALSTMAASPVSCKSVYDTVCSSQFCKPGEKTKHGAVPWFVHIVKLVDKGRPMVEYLFQVRSMTSHIITTLVIIAKVINKRICGTRQDQ